MGLRVLLVQPPIYDFSAYDFWLKPYGLLRVGGMLRRSAELLLFDFLDRTSSALPDTTKTDIWGCGKFFSEEVPKPKALESIPRRFKRFGIPREVFQNFLVDEGSFDFVLIGSSMTYWYPGVQEVLEDVREFSPKARIVVGGVYATLCYEHALSLGSDLLIQGNAIEPLWDMMELSPDSKALPYWEGYDSPRVGVLQLTDGCPFSCSYCSVPQYGPAFRARPLELVLQELEFLVEQGVCNIAFYDDALLAERQEILLPFLDEVVRRNWKVSFHTPNALHVRFIDSEVAERMAVAGFKKVFIGFESISDLWLKETGGKLSCHQAAHAVESLSRAGIERSDITAYVILGHPKTELQNLDLTMQAAHELGIRVMLSEFSPIPNTHDGELCREIVNLDEPLWHNKTAFPLAYLGNEEVTRLKALCHLLNSKL